MKYPVVIYPATEGGYVAEVPSLKGCLAQGDTIDSCLTELEIVIELWLETAKKNNLKIPTAISIINRIKNLSVN
ncbi:MAG TPA: type II toxin-antitoxin system HicB family antitoxin [Ignavibacteriales bacterium]|nr:type II toxin-antitoxin system HicB family antitoxin [Ignavibacteriales bacterium]